uniref:hypothetical protein n=1 Tax=Herbidospora sakaeratensis TaxID=564415 RepID=UPI000B319829|nr:hypothetical protein [Herbidospora sakaeratensis]
MGRRVSVLLLIAGAVVAALAVSGVFAAFGDDGPQLGGPVVVTAEPSAPAKEPSPRPSTSPAKKTRGEPVKPPPPKQGGDDDDGDDDDDDGDDD